METHASLLCCEREPVEEAKWGEEEEEEEEKKAEKKKEEEGEGGGDLAPGAPAY